LVKKIVFEVINMKQKREIVKRSLKMYHKSSKRETGEILTELSQITGYNRKYLTYLLNIAKKSSFVREKLFFIINIKHKIIYEFIIIKPLWV